VTCSKFRGDRQLFSLNVNLMIRGAGQVMFTIILKRHSSNFVRITLLALIFLFIASTAAMRFPLSSADSLVHAAAQDAPLAPPRNQDKKGQVSVSQKASVQGTVLDVNGAPVPGAAVTLQGTDSSKVRSVTTNENGFFQISDIEPGIPYRFGIRATGFSDWEMPGVIFDPGQSKVINVDQLRPEAVNTTITVTPETSVEIATQQVKEEETQHGFVLIPNFMAVYAPHPAPLTPKLKFDLAFRMARDPFTLGGASILAGVAQASDNPDYKTEGAKGYLERYAASYANYFSDAMLYSAILPTALHQDPRYFYQGKGSVKSRLLHVFSSVVITKGDDGRPQPNYSELGGDLGSAALSNLYYPIQNRGAGRVWQGFAINTALHLTTRILAEFVFHPSSSTQQRSGLY
jgi:hypothetical protein